MQFLKYFIFLLTATNQHGVHSPFVFNYVTKCIYSKKKFSTKKSLNILLKTLEYFDISTINCNCDQTEIINSIKHNFPNIEIDNTSSKFKYFDNLKDFKLSNYMNNSVVFINNTGSHNNQWINIIKNKKITVSINLFFCGILFFRKEQVKQDFKIRIFSSIFK
jgi:hypothetical protein